MTTFFAAQSAQEQNPAKMVARAVADDRSALRVFELPYLLTPGHIRLGWR
jgi:hypothetical protein